MQKITILPFLLLSLSIFAQAPQWQWARNYELFFNSGRQYSALDPEGNIYLAGDFSSATLQAGDVTLTNEGTDTADIYIIKLDQQGDVLWARSFGGNDHDSLISFATDPQGNLYLSGTYTYAITLGSETLTNIGLSNFFVKLSPDGDALWAKTHNNNNALQWESQDIAADALGNVYIAGAYVGQSLTFDNVSVAFDNANDSSGHCFVGKFDAQGNCIWLRGAQSDSPHFMGSTARSLTIDSQGNVYVAGRFGNENIDFGPVTLTKTSTAQWNANLFIVKYDADGAVQWAQRSGSAFENVTDATALVTTADDHILLSGYFNHTIQIGDIAIDAGASSSTFVAKLDPSGNAVWALPVTASNCATAHNSIDADANGNIYVSGFTNCLILGFGAGVTISTAGQGNLYVVKVDGDGQDGWARQSGNSSPANLSTINVQSPNEIYVSGTFPTETLTLGAITLTKSDSNYNMFISKLYSAPLSVNEQAGLVPAIAPVPVRDHFNIQSAEYPLRFSIADVLGKVLGTGHVQSATDQIEGGHLEPGVYFIRIDNGTSTFSQKIIKN